MSDNDILAWAVADQRLVITMDKDFGELVFRSGLPHAGILLLRLEAVRSDEKVRLARDLFALYGDQFAGRFAVSQNGRLRIR
jgi:predicted nuclease of predicted toxin-antitoxin system